MKKIIISLFVIIFLLIGCTNNINETDKISVAVSIIPEVAFVKAVAGDLVDIVVMIPPGSSPSNYQPSPKEMTVFDTADIYFSIGVLAEENIKPLISNDKMNTINLENIVSDIYGDRFFDESSHHSGTRDPHIWLSPKRVIVMVDAIKNEFIRIDPDNKIIYKQNAEKYIIELKNLDNDLKIIFNDLENKSFIIYHPAFGYFADDYDLNMIEIEEDGKDATAKGLENVINFAKENNIKFILYQEEFDVQQAKIVANEIDGVTIKVNTLSENYIDNLKEIGNKLKDILN